MNTPIKLVVVVCMLASQMLGDAGILLPREKSQPDPAILSLEEMEIDIRIDNSDARVFVRQIFANHTAVIEEGNYIFALNSRSVVSDFATWDGPVRIPAVILERKRAEEIFESLKQQAIDPGLLQMGEHSATEAGRASIFSAKITPIAAYGTKRLEFEYHESIPVESFKSYFGIALRPDAYHAQMAGHLSIKLELHSAHPLRDFKVLSSIYPLKIEERNANTIRGSFQGENVALTEDFSVQYSLVPAGDTMHVLTYRNPDAGQPNPTEMAPQRGTHEPGFFEVMALLGNAAANNRKMPTQPNQAASNGQALPAHNIVILFDNSLSMQWEKLENSYAALQKVLHSLTPADRFNVLLFNSKVSLFQPQMSVASRLAIQQASEFVQSSKLRGGTNLQQALEAGLNQCSQGAANNYLILLTDGEATRGSIQNGKLAAWYAEHWKSLPEAKRPKTYIFAVGDDANLALMKMLTRNEGVLEHVLSTEPVDFKLNSFIAKLRMSPIRQLQLEVSPHSAVELVYPLQDTSFAGSIASWVGQYQIAQNNVAFHAQGLRDGQSFDIAATADLPKQSLIHEQLPRLWAKARVDALIEKIKREGEDQATIDEIIRLARKYKFITPYTSFLAVPRALLRPRVIRPGDPILRVHTDPAITSVVALFPFGLTKPLHFLSKENVWQTRFLAPTDMADGTYNVRLVLRDRSGNTYRESKSFVIASKPPTVKLVVENKQIHRGGSIHLKVHASLSTRTLVAHLEGALPVSLHWNPDAAASTGEVAVPGDLPPGRYRLTVTAEDIAHNLGSQEVQVEVLP
jgi:Ca-activated chloride channel family protein